jgi:hypothetical protein
MASLGTALCLSANHGVAQNGGGGGGQNWRDMSPEERRQAMMDRVRETLEVKEDAEWTALQPLVQKVFDARMASFSGGFGGRGGMMGRRGGGNGGGGADNGGGRQGGPFGNQPPNPEREALQKAIDAKASKAEIKAALTKYTESRKAKQEELEKAQNDLRKVLTSRQEAIATIEGWL